MITEDNSQDKNNGLTFLILFPVQASGRKYFRLAENAPVKRALCRIILIHELII